MSAIFGGPDHYILLCAKNYATALTEYRKTADDKRPALQSNMNYLLESAKLEVEAEQRRREKHLRSTFGVWFGQEAPWPRDYCTEADAIRRLYAIPPRHCSIPYRARS